MDLKVELGFKLINYQCSMKKTKRVSRQSVLGFTLLELLVVISIISILLALGVAAFSTAQRKGRDAKRRADVKAMQDGYEQYYAAQGNYTNICTTDITDYMPGGRPIDPKNQPPYEYNCTSQPSYEYCVCATLETGGGNATNNTCTGYGSTSDGDFYCLTNLQ